jgi:hypothetical protein
MKNLLLVMTLLACTAFYGQSNNNSEYWNTWRYVAKEGMQEKFEQAAAKKTSMFNKTAETAIYTYRVITGPNTGTYERVESGKKPADYDLDRTAEGKYWRDNVGEYIAQNKGQIRWVKLKNGTYDPNPDNAAPSKYVHLTTYNVKADKIMHFRRFMNRVAEVAEKRGFPQARLLFRLVSGGNRNQFVLAYPYDKYEREPMAESETTFREDYTELFGWGSLDEDRQNFDASLEYWGEQRETMVLVPEMSTKLKN